VEQLLLRLEVVQQASRANASLPGDLPEGGTTTPVTGQQALRGNEYPLPAVLSLGEKGGVSPLIGHRSPFNQPTERTLDWLRGADKS
jgi:hypothetical protein